MLKYIIKRILIFIPTLLIISLITFFLSTTAPGDPVEQMLSSRSDQGSSANLQASEQAYIEKRQQLGLDLPIFYFAFSNAATPDTLHKIPKPAHRKNLDRFISKNGNWDQISDYYYSIKDFEKEVVSIKSDSLNDATALINVKDAIKNLYVEYDDDKINYNLGEVDKWMPKLASFDKPSYDKLKNSYSTMVGEKTTWKNFIPSFQFYGLNNQYHRWFFGDKPLFGNGDGTWKSKGFLRGDFGISYKDQRPVGSVLMDAVRWTFMMSLVSIFIVYMLAIPLGVFSARSKGKVSDQVVSTFLFLLYALPNFWLAVMGIIYLCGGDYLSWFPPFFKPDFSGNFFNDVKELVYNLTLPMILITYGGLAYLSRQMRGGMLAVLGQDYIRTARSKGLSETNITWKHAMRNSLLPIITLFAGVFPAAISGSLIIEILFSIPGMGKVGFEAVVARNYPIVFAVMMFSAILTLIGYLVSDILYAVVDPRISYKK